MLHCAVEAWSATNLRPRLPPDVKQAFVDGKNAGGDMSYLWNAFEKSGAEGLKNIALTGLKNVVLTRASTVYQFKCVR